MTVIVNGENTDLPSGETVATLLMRLQLDRSPCAVEVNENLVPKRTHADRPLADGDRVEIVTLVGGG